MRSTVKDDAETVRVDGVRTSALAQSAEIHGVAYLDGLTTPRVFTDFSFSRLTVICAEPGMGKSYLASLVVRDAAERGRTCYEYSYEGISSSKACDRVVRCCREIVRKTTDTTTPLLVIDGIAAGDERETSREASAIRKVVDSGVQVVLCLRTEDRQLAEALREAMVLGSDELIYRAYEDDVPAMACTGGVPTLVNAIHLDGLRGESRMARGNAYSGAMASLMAGLLRQTLPDEEVRARLAILLLGSGTMEEIQLVAGRCDTEMLSWLARDVPLFGIQVKRKSFSCYGVGSDEVLEHCLSSLQGVCAEEPSLVTRACGVLALRGDVRRSAVVAQLCSSEHEYVSVCVSWGVLYATIGKTRIVQDALRLASRREMSLGVRGVLSRAAVNAVMGTSRQLDAAVEHIEGIQVDTSTDRRLCRKATLLVATRDVWRNPRSASLLLTTEFDDTDGMACIGHVKASRMIASGRFGEAYALLSGQMTLAGSHGIPEALLADDMAFALAMMGGTPDARELNLVESAHEFFMQQEAVKLRSYHLALRDATEVLMGSGTETTTLEEAGSQADRAGDTFMQAFLLGVCAVADIRKRALSRAHVRASRSAEIARALGESYLASAAELVDALCLALLGETDALRQVCAAEGLPSSFALIGKASMGSLEPQGFGGAPFEIPIGIPCPPEALWVLNLLSNGCETIWSGCANAVPQSWLKTLNAVKARRASLGLAAKAQGSNGLRMGPALARRRVRRGPVGTSALQRGSQIEMLPPEPKGRIRVTVMGQFSIKCDGVVLPEGALERRRARELVALLALVPGHKMRRYQIIDVLWPSNDYFRGPRRLYEATGEARARLAERCQGAKAIMSDRKQGIVGLDGSLVSCDVDEFEREVRLVLSEDGDDLRLLEHASAMERLYAGGVDENLVLLGRAIGERAADLRNQYVDAVVAAGEAALRLGKTKLAVRYAMDAFRQGSLREDVMILLARALKAAGRGFEVRDYYGRFVRALMDERGDAPSDALQRIVADATSLPGGQPLD